MANQEHFDILNKGMVVWNQWRQEYPQISPDLSNEDFSNGDFFQANLSRANLSQAKLKGADLNRADLRNANLRGADLYRADLVSANLCGAELSGADMSRAILWVTIFGEVDLSVAKGLETVKHEGPSIISIDTIYLSQGKIPEIFLRGAGVPDSFITYARSLVSQPFDFYSSFISYSSRDEQFTKRLHADLQNHGVRCWFAPEDLKIGDKLRSRIDESIRLHDKLLLVLSEHSVSSQWVEQEVETALERERKENRVVLFPIRLDNTVMVIEGGWPMLIRNTRHIGDFTCWKDYDIYQKALERLLRDLKADGYEDEARERVN
jgi:hypothetical protein